MAFNTRSFSNRGTERVFLLLISAVMGLLFFKLFTVLQIDFQEVPGRAKQGTIMNLNDDKPGERIKLLLEKGLYYQDKKDIDLISAVVGRGRNSGDDIIDNIGELNKRKYEVSAEEAFARGGDVFKKRVKIDRALLGFSNADSAMFEQERRKPISVPAAHNLQMGNGAIRGTVERREVGQPAGGVLVRLQLVLPADSLYSENVTEVAREITENGIGVKKVFVLDTLNRRQLQSLTAYARTDAQGNVVFTGLPANHAYEVLPLKPGFEFGRSQGVQQLKKNTSFTFYQSPHTMKLFSTRDFSTLKKEKALIVRTPKEVTKWFFIIVATFFISFFLIHLLLSIRFPDADQLILPVIMILTGLSFITLFSLQDPLRDRFLAKSTLTYFGLGMTGIVILLLFNLRLFTTDSMLYRLFIFMNNRRAANGWPWALVAIGLLVLTILFGPGPEGSGVKVNLLGFQPSEVVKFIVIFF